MPPFVEYARVLSRLVGLHEHGAEGHSQRMEEMVQRMLPILRETSMLPDDAGYWPQAMLVHDLGKLFIPSQILRKPGPLSAAERGLVEQHTTMGREELDRLSRRFSGEDAAAARFWLLAAQVAGGHHERPDGEGYPLGLRGRAVPLVLRVARTVDVFDTLTSRRSYRDALTLQEALREMREEIGSFDEVLLRALEAALAASSPMQHSAVG
jgi:putative two-component system response regulator